MAWRGLHQRESPQRTAGGAAESAFLSRLIASLTVSATGLCGDASCAASRAHNASAAWPDTACRQDASLLYVITKNPSRTVNYTKNEFQLMGLGFLKHACRSGADKALEISC